MHMRLLLIALLLASALLAGCGVKTYSITTNAGQEYTAEGAPIYDVKSQTYTFTDANGRQVVVDKDDIRTIREQ